MSKVIKTKYNLDEVVTRRILQEELRQGFKNFKEELSKEAFERDTLLAETLSHFVTREEYYQTMDQVLGELKAIREELAAGLSIMQRHDKQLESHDKRILVTERKLGIASSVVA